MATLHVRLGLPNPRLFRFSLRALEQNQFDMGMPASSPVLAAEALFLNVGGAVRGCEVGPSVTLPYLTRPTDYSPSNTLRLFLRASSAWNARRYRSVVWTFSWPRSRESL